MPWKYYSIGGFELDALALVFIPVLLAYLLVVGFAALRLVRQPGRRLTGLGLVCYAYLLGFAAPAAVLNTSFTIGCWVAQAVWLCFRARHAGYTDFRSFLIAMAAFAVDLTVALRVFDLAGYPL